MLFRSSDLVAKTGIDFQLPINNSANPSKPTTLEANANKALLGAWYPIFFDDYSEAKLNSLVKSIQNGRVGDIEIQFDRNSDLATKIAKQIEAKTSKKIVLIQSSPPDSTNVTYERNRVTVIVKTSSR